MYFINSKIKQKPVCVAFMAVGQLGLCLACLVKVFYADTTSIICVSNDYKDDTIPSHQEGKNLRPDWESNPCPLGGNPPRCPLNYRGRQSKNQNYNKRQKFTPLYHTILSIQ